MKTRTKIAMVAAGTIACGLAVWGIVSALSSGVPVKSAAVERGPIRAYVEERATTELPQTYLITMPYDGRIEPIEWAENTPVSRGDVVARLAPEDLEWALAEAQAQYDRANAAVAENADLTVEQFVLDQASKFVEAAKASAAGAKTQIDSGWAALRYANNDLRRVQDLRRTSAQTEDDLEQAVLRQVQSDAAYRQAVESYKTMRWFEIATDLMPKMVQRYIDRKEKLTAEVLAQQRAEAFARLQRAKLDFARGTLTSPIDGVVTKRHQTNRRQLSAGTVLLEIGRLEDLQVEAEVLTLDVANVQPGQEVEIFGPAIGATPVRGSVRRVDPAGFTKISSLGVEQQRVKVVIDFDAATLQRLLAERRLGVAYRVRVRIITDAKTEALVVPRSALFRSNDGAWKVYAIRDGRATLRTVQLGLFNDRLAEITEGLAEGEQVVLAPESDLADGARVAIESD